MWARQPGLSWHACGVTAQAAWRLMLLVRVQRGALASLGQDWCGDVSTAAVDFALFCPACPSPPTDPVRRCTCLSPWGGGGPAILSLSFFLSVALPSYRCVIAQAHYQLLDAFGLEMVEMAKASGEPLHQSVADQRRPPAPLPTAPAPSSTWRWMAGWVVGGEVQPFAPAMDGPCTRRHPSHALLLQPTASPCRRAGPPSRSRSC